MNGKVQSGNCRCGTDAASTAAPVPSSDDGVSKFLKAHVPQDYEANIRVRVVPGRSLKDVGVLAPRCRPRGHSTGWTPGLVALNPDLVATLAKADKVMVAWLAKDQANTQRFLADPVGAMREAGVELSRSDEKALARASVVAAAARVVPPGVRVASLAAQTIPNGRVGHIDVVKPGATPDAKTDNFGCGPKRKG